MVWFLIYMMVAIITELIYMLVTLPLNLIIFQYFSVQILLPNNPIPSSVVILKQLWFMYMVANLPVGCIILGQFYPASIISS